MSILSFQAMADITCYTSRMSKKIVIKDSSIAISKPFLKDDTRAVASLGSIRTKFLGQGYDKIAFYQGEKNIIHIENTGKFSEENDYLLIRSAKGHEMTYPLSCE